MAKINPGFKSIGGAYVHVITNDKGNQIGWIEEVFRDVFYVKFASITGKGMYADVTRYRRINDALLAFHGI